VADAEAVAGAGAVAVGARSNLFLGHSPHGTCFRCSRGQATLIQTYEAWQTICLTQCSNVSYRSEADTALCQVDVRIAPIMGHCGREGSSLKEVAPSSARFNPARPLVG